jgi:hypothetical protein
LESLPGVLVLGGGESPPPLSEVARALRYPDLSIVLDLSRVAHDEKVAYLEALLPRVAALRQSTGQPHWIVVDEAHYFLHEPDVTQGVDVELAAYVLVTYRVSDLDVELLRSVKSIVVTQLTDPREAQALTAMYGPEGAQSEWDALLRGLKMDEAALLLKVDEPQRKLQRFKVDGAIDLGSSRARLPSQQGAFQDATRGAEIDHDSRHIDERRDKGCRGGRWVKAPPLQNERKHRAG